MLTKPPETRGVHRRLRASRKVADRRGIRFALLGAGALVLLAGVLLIGLRTSRSGVLPNVELAGISVGGQSEADLRTNVRRLARDVAGATVTVVRPALGAAGAGTTSARTAELGYSIDVEATVRTVLHRGRQGNPLSALLDQLRASFVTLRVKPIGKLDEGAYAAWVQHALEEVSTKPKEGDLQFSGTNVMPVYPESGATASRDELRDEALRAAVKVGSRARDGRVTLTPLAIAPKSTAADVETVLARAREVLAGPITLEHGKGKVTFTADELGRVLDVHVVEGSEAANLELVARANAVDRVVSAEERAAVESEPVDASFKLSGGKVKVVPSKRGFRFAPEKAAAQLIDVATTADRRGKLKGDKVQPELTTAQARALNIDQQVSTFTTYYPCCQPRVTNIHRIADIIRGKIVMPGEVFSINDVVGERTAAKGFVGAPAISEGEFVEQIGGGISQFATTTYNAIFFGGYELREHQAHSYWFSRYPMGREATVSWPAPDLSFRNDSAYGVYIQTSYTATSITVTFYGHQPIRVETTTGPQTNITQPEVQCEEDAGLAKGEIEVVQEGSQGFDVTVTRTLRYPDGTSKKETYFTRYKAEPIIEYRRTCPED